MGLLPGRSLVPPVAALVAFALALSTAPARATYVGLRDATTVGTVAVGGGWIAVPQYEESSDPGTITGAPHYETSSSLLVARVTGSRFISFRSVSPAHSETMEPMLAMGAAGVLAVVWSDRAGSGTIDSDSLNAAGNLLTPATQTGMPKGDALRLTAGPDGAYALWWGDPAGAHALVFVPGGLLPGPGENGGAFLPLLGPNVQFDPSDQIVLAGGRAFWLLDWKPGALSAAPAVFGQEAAPTAVALGAAIPETALGDGAGGLWVLARGARGWFAAHLDPSGHLSSTSLPHGAADVELANAGKAAVVAYSAAPHCTGYLERLRPGGAANTVVERRKLIRQGGACATPRGLAVDPGSATAFLLAQSRRSTTLTAEARGGAVHAWHAPLAEAIDTVVAAGAGHVVVESHAPERAIPEQCGGAGPSYTKAYFIRVFHGARLERTGRLGASVTNC